MSAGSFFWFETNNNLKYCSSKKFKDVSENEEKKWMDSCIGYYNIERSTISGKLKVAKKKIEKANYYP